MEGILSELNRCRELLKAYEEIGPAGAFGKAMIQATIKETEAAIGRGEDATVLLPLYERLKNHE